MKLFHCCTAKDARRILKSGFKIDARGRSCRYELSELAEPSDPEEVVLQVEVMMNDQLGGLLLVKEPTESGGRRYRVPGHWLNSHATVTQTKA